MSPSAGVIKLGVDVHLRQSVVIAQWDHGALKPPQRFTPGPFVPWLKTLREAGPEVHVVYEACGFGFVLCRALLPPT